MSQKIILLFFITFVSTAKAQTVTLDYFFNQEFRTTKEGTTERFHYTWEDTTNSGYAVWGNLFRSNGLQTKSLEAAPTPQNLKGTDIYIIVDPDTKKEAPDPHFIEEVSIKTITDWVKAGGVLVMLANDSANVELAHFNKLAEVFGIHFNADNRNRVDGNKFEMGAQTVPPDHPIFKTARKIYLKEICTFTLSGEAKPALTDQGDVIMATAKYGRGTVLAIGDPFIYNEYCNGRLPRSFDNDKAADDVCKWLKQQVAL